MSRARDRSGGLQRYHRQVREIQAELDVSYDEARTLWRDYYRPGGLPRSGRSIRRAAARAIEVTLRAMSVPQDCLYCRDRLGDDVTTTCESCGAVYHSECITDELGGNCANLGCRSQSPSAIFDRRIRIQERRATRAVDSLAGPMLVLLLMVIIVGTIVALLT